MATSRCGLYDDPMIYDVLHAPGTAEEVGGLERIERRFVDPKRTTRARLWLEPACGSGRYLREANRRGIDTIGFDLNQGMIDYAEDHTPQPAPGVGDADYFVGDMTGFAERIGRRRVSFAFNLINTIRHLPSDDAMLAHFAQMAEVLAPGAVYVVGLSHSAYGRESPSEDVWVGARGRLRVTQVVQFIPPRSEGNPRSRGEHVISHLSIERPRGVEHRDSAYHLRCYSGPEWDALVRKSPLRAVATIDEQGEDAPAPDSGYILHVLSHA